MIVWSCLSCTFSRSCA